MLRNVSRCSELRPDVQNCVQMVRITSRRSEWPPMLRIPQRCRIVPRCLELPPDAQNCTQMLRIASRCLDLPLDAQNCSQMFRIALRCSELCPESKNCRNLFKQILTMVAKSFELERASRSHAKTGSQNHQFRVWGPPKTGPFLTSIFNQF